MKLGYVADKKSLKVSASEQRSMLGREGIDLAHIYDPEQGWKVAVSDCRAGDVLYVYSAAVFGAHAYPDVIKALALQGANLHVLRKELLVDCTSGESVADGALDIKQAHATSGQSGRPRAYSEDVVSKVIAYVEDGNTQKDAAAEYNVSKTAVSKIMNGIY